MVWKDDLTFRDSRLSAATCLCHIEVYLTHVRVKDYVHTYILHLWAGLTAASWIIEPLRKIGANFALQLSSRSHFTKVENKKKLSAKINVKNILNRV